MSDHRVDIEGRVYRQGFDGQWRQQVGLFGPEKDVSLFGQPNIKRDLLGQPIQARDFFSSIAAADTGLPLYHPDSPVSNASAGGGGGDLLTLLIILLFYGVILAAVTLLGTLYGAWRSLWQRYPRAMLVVHLLAGMAAVRYGLAAAGSDLPIQLGGAALVPGLWGWLWLTRHLPLVFMPLNAVITGAGLWTAAEMTRAAWSPVWLRCAAGLPLLANLPAVLAVLPAALLLWGYAARRWPKMFAPLNRLAVGAVLVFALTRVWTAWIPLWTQWTAPIPALPAADWLIFLTPIALWLWHHGQLRWPVFFFALKLLVFGGLLGLVAYHTQPSWIDGWERWTAGLPFSGFPFLVISLSPITLWTWGWASHRWTKVLAVPNRLLTGAVLWLIVDRTRILWTELWRELWGEVPARPDLAMLVLAMPLAIWLWRRGGERLPRWRGALRALLLGAVLWWLAERSRAGWQAAWWKLAQGERLDPALLAALTPLGLWSWRQLSRRWPQTLTIFTLAALAAGLFWTAGRLWPGSTVIIRTAAALLPLAAWGWGQFLRRRPRLGWMLSALILTAAVLLIWSAPGHPGTLAHSVAAWLQTQGVPLK